MTSPDRVAVLGCGLVGTSIAMAVARAGGDVVGFDTHAAVLAAASARSGLKPAGDVAEAVDGASVAFVCTPVPAIADVVLAALAADPAVVVTDAGSVKVSIVDAVVAAAGEVAGRFVGGHPMGGSERSGPDGASASIIDDAVWVLTPTSATDPDAVGVVQGWVERSGANPVRMEPEAHDRVVAVVSHLPQVAATALMNLAAREEEGQPETLLLAAGGFRDLTRLAASDPHLWAGILSSNRDELVRAVDLYADELASLRDLVAGGDEPGVERTMAAATEERRRLTAKPQVRTGVAILQVGIDDRPGVLAELTAAFGERDVNIEDIQLVHSPEGGRGSVHVTVAAGDADRAVEGLAVHSFEAVRIA
ncbi:MAG: prephenate dehydrogenase/arogenate dehydrogenase family protein [Actinomycetota bacterium]